MLFDTHVHYNLPPFYENWQAHWAKAKAAGVEKSIIVGAGLNSSKKAIEVASQAEGLYAAIGKHPDVYRKAVKIKLQEQQDWQEVLSDIDEDIKILKKLIIDNREVIKAIGEIGLDYFRMPEKGDKRAWMIEAQKKAFEAQINLALEFNLPIIVHVRDKVSEAQANWDVLEIIRTFKTKNPELSFVLHCVTGPEDYLKKALDLGAFAGVDGNVTYEDAQAVRELIALVPQDRLLLETDAPYLAPEPHKGEVCEPWMVSVTAKFLEEKLGISARQLYDNACRFFNTN